MTEQTVSSSVGSDLWKRQAALGEFLAHLPGAAYFLGDTPTSAFSITAADIAIVYPGSPAPTLYVLRDDDQEQEQERWDEAAGEAITRLDSE